MALSAPAALTAGIETSKLDRIRLNNDQEPWISGAAEIFAVVSGVQPEQAKATLTVVDMPYLDHDGTDYTPNQIMIFWPEYRFAAANVQLFEHDDNTNYKDLAVALSQGVTAILGAFAPTYAVIGQVATAILQAMLRRTGSRMMMIMWTASIRSRRDGSTRGIRARRGMRR
ncbi:DUF3103 domain-containing protein [Massilia sp. B-10]|nr:DUF3103 domain-containing protein [Massilia sp. B-10]